MAINFDKIKNIIEIKDPSGKIHLFWSVVHKLKCFLLAFLESSIYLPNTLKKNFK